MQERVPEPVFGPFHDKVHEKNEREALHVINCYSLSSA